MFRFGGLETVKGLRRPFWIKQSRTLDRSWLKFENFLGGCTARTSTALLVLACCVPPVG